MAVWEAWGGSVAVSVDKLLMIAGEFGHAAFYVGQSR